MTLQGLNFPEQAIAEFCLRHGVKRLSLFGSILRVDFGPDSDVDLLVEFLPGRTPGMFGFGAMIEELGAMIGRQVDLRTPEDLSRYLRRGIMDSARPLHAA
jgi:predicted nucleotidyltransferase